MCATPLPRYHPRLLGLQAAHAAVLWWASRTALVRPVWRRLLTGAWLLSLCLVNTEVISRYEALAFATFVVAACALRRLRVAVLTLRANHKPNPDPDPDPNPNPNPSPNPNPHSNP